jgi:fatty-acid desaturase
MIFSGFFDLPWWGYGLLALGLTHVTIAAVTIYLHRCQAHRALELHPVVSLFFRLWLWLTTGMVTKECTTRTRSSVTGTALRTTGSSAMCSVATRRPA